MIQQSSYTLSIVWEDNFRLSKHEDALEAGSLGDTGKWIKIDIPVT